MTFVSEVEFSPQAIFFHTLLGFHYRVEKGDFVGIVRFRGRPFFTYVYIRRGRFADVIDLHNPVKTVYLSSLAEKDGSRQPETKRCQR